ncbi:hypothetical protein HBQ05_06785 [Staphylococcus aureus]|nr:hypothetical protein [Staphylococcus aureus]MBR9624085.1 hypothetical protein [Staphylococcus aureus]
MNKINDRDLTELSSYWVYQDINKDNDFTVNGKRFKQVDEYNDNGNKNKKGELKDANKLSEYNYMQNETYKSA